MNLHNINIPDSAFNGAKGSLMSFSESGWFASKNYTSIDGGGVDIQYKKDYWYEATIDSYQIIGFCTNEKSFQYLNLRCTVLLDSGLWSFEYSIPVNTGNSSKLCKLFFNLGFPISSMRVLEFDALIGSRVKVLLDTSTDKGNFISEINHL